jgi:hypothetical protein
MDAHDHTTGLEICAPILSLTNGYGANPITGVDSNRKHIPVRPPTRLHSQLTFDLAEHQDDLSRFWPPDIVAESFNLLNHRNVSRLNTVFGSGIQPQASFGQPIATSAARRIQFSLDYEARPVSVVEQNDRGRGWRGLDQNRISDSGSTRHHWVCRQLRTRSPRVVRPAPCGCLRSLQSGLRSMLQR